MYTTFIIFLGNFSFIVLFISMLIYWIQATNFEYTFGGRLSPSPISRTPLVEGDHKHSIPDGAPSFPPKGPFGSMRSIKRKSRTEYFCSRFSGVPEIYNRYGAPSFHLRYRGQCRFLRPVRIASLLRAGISEAYNKKLGIGICPIFCPCRLGPNFFAQQRQKTVVLTHPTRSTARNRNTFFEPSELQLERKSPPRNRSRVGFFESPMHLLSNIFLTPFPIRRAACDTKNWAYTYAQFFARPGAVAKLKKKKPGIGICPFYCAVSSFFLTSFGAPNKVRKKGIQPVSKMQRSWKERWGGRWAEKTSSFSYASIGILISNLSIFILLVLRWKESGHFPLSNLYESLMFLSWSLTFIHLFIEIIFLSGSKRLFFYLNLPFYLPFLPQSFPFFLTSFGVPNEVRKKGETAKKKSQYINGVENLSKPFHKSENKILINKLIGSITAPCALFTNAFATFSLPKEIQESSFLVPALQSNWLMMHVTVMILSYAALILGSLLSIGYLVVTRVDQNRVNIFSGLYTSSLLPRKIENRSILFSIFRSFFPCSMAATGPAGAIAPGRPGAVALPQSLLRIGVAGLPHPVSAGPEGTPISEAKMREGMSPEQEKRLNLAKTLDNLSYRLLGLGFPLLTIGILSGAVWANEAWGSYWSWDPKETWALLTWLVFAIYLHTRLTKGWQGTKPAIIASVGFITVWICFLGVNLIGEGLHSYGWVS